MILPDWLCRLLAETLLLWLPPSGDPSGLDAPRYADRRACQQSLAKAWPVTDRLIRRAANSTSEEVRTSARRIRTQAIRAALGAAPIPWAGWESYMLSAGTTWPGPYGGTAADDWHAWRDVELQRLTQWVDAGIPPCVACAYARLGLAAGEYWRRHGTACPMLLAP